MSVHLDHSLYTLLSILVEEVTVLVSPFSFSMAPCSKASAPKNTVSDASSSTAAPGRDPESKLLDSANLQIHIEEMEGAVRRAISVIDQGRGVFVDLKQTLLDRVTRIRRLGDYRLTIRCSMRLIDLESLINKLENLRQANLESVVESLLASAHRREAWQRECRRRDIEDKESFITRLDLRRRLLQTEIEGTTGSISLDRTPYAEGESILTGLRVQIKTMHGVLARERRDLLSRRQEDAAANASFKVRIWQEAEDEVRTLDAEKIAVVRAKLASFKLL